jgi:phage N-6-adenine-methyltransferase
MAQGIKPFDKEDMPDEDSYETPRKLFEHLEKIYGLNFQLDAAAKQYNSQCKDWLENAMFDEWAWGDDRKEVDVWCNPPHSITGDFIRRADAQHKKYNINICMIVPTRCQSMAVWHELIEDELTVFVENHPIKKRPRFLKLGRPTKHASQNAYRVIIWRTHTPIN